LIAPPRGRPDGTIQDERRLGWIVETADVVEAG